MIGAESTRRTAFDDGWYVCTWLRPIRATSVAQTADEPALFEVPCNADPMQV